MMQLPSRQTSDLFRPLDRLRARLTSVTVSALLLGLLPSAWSLPVTLDRDAWFSYSSFSTSLAPAALIDISTGTTALSAPTVTSVSRTGGGDPFALPNTPAYADPRERLDVTRRGTGAGTFFSGQAQASLGDGAARGFSRMGWGDGRNTMTVTAALGDVVTVAPGGSLDVGLSFSGGLTKTFERVTPFALFPPGPGVAEAVTFLHSIGSVCEIQLLFVGCTGPDHAFGVGVRYTMTLGVWEYAFQSDSPFSRFGESSTVDCAGAVICLTQSLHEGVFAPLTGGTQEGPDAFSFWESGGIFGASASESLSKGSGGKFYVGLQLALELEPEVSGWGSLDDCLAGPWGRSFGAGEEVCRPQFTEPGLAFDMSRSLELQFSGDAAFTSQSGVFLSGNDVPEPGTFALALLAAAAAARSRVSRSSALDATRRSPLRDGHG